MEEVPFKQKSPETNLWLVNTREITLFHMLTADELFARKLCSVIHYSMQPILPFSSLDSSQTAGNWSQNKNHG